MARKTIEVRYIVERGNYFLAHSEDEQRDERKGVCSMIELALHKADAYKGYRHLGENDPNSAGIPWHLQGKPFSYIDKRDEFHNPVNARLRTLSADDSDGFARFIAHAISDGGYHLHIGPFHPIDDTRREYHIG